MEVGSAPFDAQKSDCVRKPCVPHGTKAMENFKITIFDKVWRLRYIVWSSELIFAGVLKRESRAKTDGWTQVVILGGGFGDYLRHSDLAGGADVTLVS